MITKLDYYGIRLTTTPNSSAAYLLFLMADAALDNSIYVAELVDNDLINYPDANQYGWQNIGNEWHQICLWSGRGVILILLNLSKFR